MIQRIQSFFLVLAAVCVALLFMFPIATYVGQYATSSLNLIPQPSVEDELGNVTFIGQADYIHLWPLAVLAALIGVIALVSIFLYKNRIIQIRWVAFGFLLNVVYIFLVFFWATDSYLKHIGYLFGDAPHVTYSVGTWAPIASALLFFLAQRAIKKDEEKVRAADRLR
ncbi:MAG: DUF4293 domain-containing protein [Bacteroidales bacterium]|nr:DUF4293 domain-containing protein [Bacteroidales bacterium]